MTKKNRKSRSRLDVEIKKHRKFPPRHKVAVVLGTGDKDYKFPDNLPACVADKLDCKCKQSHVSGSPSESQKSPEPEKVADSATAEPVEAENKPAEKTDHGRTNWSQALPIIGCQHESVPVPAIELTSCFGCFSRNRISKMAADVFVVTVMHNAEMAGPFRALDECLGGVLSRAIEEEGFTGQLGERFLLDISELQRPQKYILVVGLGEPQAFTGPTACSLFRLVTEVAEKVGASSVLLPIPPRRLWNDAVSLRGTGAILRCRLEERALRGELHTLKKFEVVCSPQARPYLEEGLGLHGARCQLCNDPQLPENSK